MWADQNTYRHCNLRGIKIIFRDVITFEPQKVIILYQSSTERKVFPVISKSDRLFQQTHEHLRMRGSYVPSYTFLFDD